MLPGAAAPLALLPGPGAARGDGDGCWPLAEWLALSGLNAAFRAALAPQPIALRLAPGWRACARAWARWSCRRATRRPPTPCCRLRSGAGTQSPAPYSAVFQCVSKRLIAACERLYLLSCRGPVYLCCRAAPIALLRGMKPVITLFSS